VTISIEDNRSFTINGEQVPVGHENEVRTEFSHIIDGFCTECSCKRYVMSNLFDAPEYPEPFYGRYISYTLESGFVVAELIQPNLN